MPQSRTSTSSPAPNPAKAAPDDPQPVVTCISVHTILEQIKFKKLSKRLRSLKVRPTAEGSVPEKPIKATETSVESVISKFPDPTTDPQSLASLLSLSHRVRSLVTGPTTERCIIASANGNPHGGSDSERYLTCPSSPAGSNDESQQYSTCPRSPAGSSASPRNSTGASLPVGSSNSQISATCVSSELAGRTQVDSTCASSDTRRSSTGGKSESQRHSTLASSDLRRYSTGVRSETKRNSTFASSNSRHSRRFSTGARLDSQRHPTYASDPRRYSTGARFDSQRRPGTYASSDSRRHSTCGNDTPSANSKKAFKALLTPGMSMSTFMSIIFAEEALVNQSGSRIPLGSSSGKRSSTDVLVQSLSTESLDLSTIQTGPEIEAPEDQDQYSNSNISWSTPLDNDLPSMDDSPTKEEPRQSIAGRSSSASIPFDHFAAYVGSERKKFVIPSKVVRHELFKQLMVSENYNLEEREDGKVSIVLLCDADYFQRLLFFVDQREKYEASMSASSCSKRYNVVAPEPKISVVSSSGMVDQEIM